MLKRYNYFSLDGEWSFRFDPEDRGGDEGFMMPVGGERFLRTCNIPCTYEGAAPERTGYRGTVWFRKNFSADIPVGELCFLEFLAVNYRADVWLNGEYVGTHTGGYLPFRFEISRYLRAGEENLLCVRVNNRIIPGMLPPSHFWRGHGGIIRSVRLYTTPVCRLDEVRVTKNGDRLSIRSLLVNEGENAQNAILTHTLSDGRQLLRKEVTVPPKGSIRHEAEIPAEGFALWSPDTPVLYQLKTALFCGEKYDAAETEFGVREISVSDGSILLNGKPIVLRGFDRHEDSPRTGLATDLENSERDFRIIKDMNANFIRFCHYPHSEEELSICDRLGLIASVEIPLNATCVGIKEYDENATKLAMPQIYMNACTAADEMVERDYNHPCVFFWCASNETNETESVIREINDALIRRFKKLDPTRLTTHVSQGCYWNGGCNVMEPLFRYDDVICINSYVTMEHRGKTFGPADREHAKHFWDTHLPELHKKYPGKPIVVMEFGYPTDKIRDGIDDEQAQTETLLCDIEAMEGRVSGWAIWHFADHAWELSEDGSVFFGSVYSPYGVFTRDRKPKLCVEALRDAFSK